MEIQVDFEGRNPQDPDFHGIKTLLQQLFLKAHIDLSNLTELIISQNYIGSVIKQSTDGPESDDDEDDDVNDVFGITTAINISDRQVKNCTETAPFSKGVKYSRKFTVMEIIKKNVHVHDLFWRWVQIFDNF